MGCPNIYTVGRAGPVTARDTVSISRRYTSADLELLPKIEGARYEIVYARPDSLVPPESLKVEVKRPKTRVWAPVWTGK